MARPTKLDPARQAAIVAALAIGATRKDAAEANGVDYRTFLNWFQWGEVATRGQYFQFFQSVTRAEAEARIKFTNTIARAAANDDWRAAETWLKRRDRENWGDNVAVKHEGAIKINLSWDENGDTDADPA